MKQLIVLTQLIKRSLKIFLQDKAGVFFSMLAPLIILMLYILFLGDMQFRALEEAFIGMGVDSEYLKGFVDGWMLAGVVAVSCLTVSFSAQSIMIKDKEDGVLSDTLIAPINRIIIKLGYLISNYLITIIICLFVVIVAFIYLVFTGWYLSLIDVFAIIGALLLSALSSCLLSSIICKLLKTSNAHSALVGILSAVLGFVIGAYMPVSMFPQAIQYGTLFVPGTYSAAIFRNLFMEGTLEKISASSLEAAAALRLQYGVELDFFGNIIDIKEILIIFVITIIISVVIYLVMEAGIFRKKKKDHKNLVKKTNK